MPTPLCQQSFVLCGPTTLAGADLVFLNGLMIDDGEEPDPASGRGAGTGS
jgi:hypothetical protein